MEPQSKKNQAKYDKYGSIMPSHIFPWKPQFLGLILGDKRTAAPCSEIYPQNLSTHDLVVWVIQNSKGGDGIIQCSQKE